MDKISFLALVITVLLSLTAMAALAVFIYTLKLMSGLMREIRFSLEILFPKVAQYPKNLPAHDGKPIGPTVTLSDQWNDEIEPRS